MGESLNEAPAAGEHDVAGPAVEWPSPAVMKVGAILAAFVGLVGLVCGLGRSQPNAAQPMSRAQAGSIAVARLTGGTVLSGIMDTDWGRVVWSLDMAMPGTRDRMEMEVDAVDGEIVSMWKVTAADEDGD